MKDVVHRALLRACEFLGVPPGKPHGRELWVASLGGLLGIALTVAVTHYVLGEAAVALVPSLGAAAVIVFVAPHSQFAQPWALLAGNVLSALTGVLCQRLVPEPTLAAAVAVAAAIAVMHLARCLHPPGGATALAAVIGGPAIHELGFSYALFPVGLNCLLLAIAAWAFNHPFPWRRYPVSLMRYAPAPTSAPARASVPLPATHEVQQAMDQLDVVIDASAAELADLIRHALHIARDNADRCLPAVSLGHFYCNDRPGQQWAVRQLVDERRSDDPAQDLVIYRVVQGHGLNRTGSCTRREFARWVGSEFVPKSARR
jgi:CBS-domain-containing membrane protein